MRDSLRNTARRVLVIAVVLGLCVGTQLPPTLAQAASGNVVIRGKVFLADSGDPLAGARIHAVHLDTKEVYTSEPSAADGSYELTRLPFGYYDLAVESSTGLFLANRVINAPAGERIEVSMLLGPPQPEDTEWWSADPDRRIPGLDRVPDGVSRIVEGIPRKAPVAEAARATTTDAARRTARLAQARWLVPVLVAGGLLTLVAVLDDDGDDAEDQGATPF